MIQFIVGWLFSLGHEKVFIKNNFVWRRTRQHTYSALLLQALLASRKVTMKFNFLTLSQPQPCMRETVISLATCVLDVASKLSYEYLQTYKLCLQCMLLSQHRDEFWISSRKVLPKLINAI